MTSRPPSWTKYEAAILLEAFLATLDGSLSRADAVKKVSDILREMAINQGMKIDETYRNENGVFFQMHSMESAYYGRTIFKPATKLFIEVVNTYYSSLSEYQNLVEKAMEMANGLMLIEDEAQ